MQDIRLGQNGKLYCLSCDGRRTYVIRIIDNNNNGCLKKWEGVLQFKRKIYCRVLLFAQCRCRLVIECPREGNNQQCCLRSRHHKNKTEIQTRTTAIFTMDFFWTSGLNNTALSVVLESLPTMSASFHILLDTSPNSALWVVLPRLNHLTPQHEFLFTGLHFVLHYNSKFSLKF